MIKNYADQNSYRRVCYSCLKAVPLCYCSLLKPFQSSLSIVVLTHPKEFRKAINTGKMVRNVISNCKLFVDTDFSDNSELDRLIAESPNAYLLFPGAEARNIEDLKSEPELFHNGLFIVIDATWSMAKKMLRMSPNLASLPRMSFRSELKSRYEIRKQPFSYCLSTIETVHYILEQLDASSDPKHDNLIEVFSDMVDKQIAAENGDLGYR